MKVCMIGEGGYPYVHGGVSSWMQMLIQAYSDIEFVILAIATTKAEMSEHKYNVPPNVTEIITYYLGEQQHYEKSKPIKMPKEDVETLENLILAKPEDIEWGKTIRFLMKHKTNVNDILMGESFFHIALKLYKTDFTTTPFNDFLWNLRGMYQPLFQILTLEIPKVDVIHSVSTGYAGMMGSVLAYMDKVPFMLSEHGIYTREREEDIIRATWLLGDFKGIWIDFFKKLSLVAYASADIVTTLFNENKELQMELGCDEEKIIIIPNGIDVDILNDATPRKEETLAYFNIGAILRIVPIKDVKTMLLGYMLAKKQQPNLRLNILGNFDEDPEYSAECQNIVAELQIPDVIFHGRVNIKEYVLDFDLLLLTSISEGQPLAVLEGLSAAVPFICTNVGDCRNVIEGRNIDDMGPAGYIVPIMDTEALAERIVHCARHPEETKKMGQIGKVRVTNHYDRRKMFENFLKLYNDLYEQGRRS